MPMIPSRMLTTLPPADTGQADFGMVGLAVMGANVALNVADHGFRTSAYNRTTSVGEQFVKENPQTPGGLTAFKELKDFVASLKRPRKVMILVKAGAGTDAVIASLEPLMEKGDIIIDGGNALWSDTIRREKDLSAKGLRFLGSGVSGGELGARFGPSLMAGGTLEAWEFVKPIWEAIAAKVDAKTGKPLEGAAPGRPVAGGAGVDSCAAYIGPGGAGHYVKMVHNGIEYADMQMICEAYDLLRSVVGLRPAEMAPIFAQWNKGELDSFLIEITADILGQKDPRSGKPFVDIVLDAAGQKGTGKWTSVSALDLGVPAATIAEAVFARCMSAIKDERVSASKMLNGPVYPESHGAPGSTHAGKPLHFDGPREVFIEAVRDALLCSKIAAYAQGFALIGAAAKEQGWTPDFGAMAKIWRGGCIIRAGFLQHITNAYAKNPSLANLMLDPYFAGVIAQRQLHWRKVVATASMMGTPIPSFSSALSYYDSYRSAGLPANLLQAQRDYFGAHTYERVDDARGKFFHLDWPEPGRPERPATAAGH